MKDLDILKVAIEQVSAILGEDMWVADRLPRAEDLAENLPAVVIDVLPGDEVTPWGGEDGIVVGELLALDIEIIAESRAQATLIAADVRAALHQLPYQDGLGVRWVNCPRFATREDINHHIRVLGTTVDVGATPN